VMLVAECPNTPGLQQERRAIPQRLLHPPHSKRSEDMSMSYN
jgi:hypothetical protein